MNALPNIPYGYCHCGCGQKTEMAKTNDRSKNWVKGEPLLFIKNHNGRVNGVKRAESTLGNKSISSHGYVVIHTGVRSRQYEHILIAEQILNRPLNYISKGHPDNEVVHHIDGDKTNNANSNLLICTHQFHVELHHKLEQSENWPQFKKVVRNPYGNKGRRGAHA